MTPRDRAELLMALADMGDALADRKMRQVEKRAYWWEEPDMVLSRQQNDLDQARIFHHHAVACRNQASAIMKRELLR